MTEIKPLAETELQEIEERCSLATPGPWYVRATDDEACSSALYIGLRPNPRNGEQEIRADNQCGLYAGGRQQEPPENVIAITVLQNPYLAYVGPDDRTDENTIFIAHARDDVPRLIAEIRRLLAEVQRLSSNCIGSQMQE